MLKLHVVIFIALIVLSIKETSCKEKVIQKCVGINDPINFINFTERCKVFGRYNGQKMKITDRKIIYPREDCDLNEIVNADVDLESKLLIEYCDFSDLQGDTLDEFEAEITIKGFLTSEGNQQSIEIPGYSEIGKPDLTKYARVRSISSTIASLNGLSKKYADIFKDFSIYEAAFHPEEFLNDYKLLKDTTQKDITENFYALKREADLLKNNSISLTNQMLEIKNSFDTNNANAYILYKNKKTNLNKTDTISDSNLTNNKDFINLFNIEERLTQLKNEQKNVISNLEKLGSVSLKTDLALKNFYKLKEGIRNILDNKTFLRTYAEQILMPDNKILIQIIIEKANNGLNLDLVIRLTKEIQDKLLLLENNELTMGKDEESIIGILTAVRVLESELYTLSNICNDSALEESVKTSLLKNLTPTEVSLPNIGAKAGDRITIQITNKLNKSDNDTPRSTTRTFNFIVNDFGLVRRVSDSFILINRLFTKHGIQSDTNSNVITTTAPKEMNFEPCAGTTLAWTFNARNDFVGWIKPGFGLNVSFPRFGTKVRTVTVDTSGNRSVNKEEKIDPIDISAGFVTSLFDGAVYFTYGWALTAGDGPNKQYWGVGFSFVNIAQKISDVVTSRND
jgi:hypothetical protein